MMKCIWRSKTKKMVVCRNYTSEPNISQKLRPMQQISEYFTNLFPNPSGQNLKKKNVKCMQNVTNAIFHVSFVADCELHWTQSLQSNKAISMIPMPQSEPRKSWCRLIIGKDRHVLFRRTATMAANTILYYSRRFVAEQTESDNIKPTMFLRYVPTSMLGRHTHSHTMVGGLCVYSSSQYIYTL